MSPSSGEKACGNRQPCPAKGHHILPLVATEVPPLVVAGAPPLVAVATRPPCCLLVATQVGGKDWQSSFFLDVLSGCCCAKLTQSYGVWSGLVARARCGGQATWAVELLFFRTSGHLPHAPCDPSGCTCAVIVFGRCPPSIEGRQNKESKSISE